ncbi:hypothetical protein [Nonomuraea typhae]|uniref:hypothetical protein n=1 Tax=Nonomuraea typhae TaxID=2603600 RepID=UPI0012FA2A11|nr:hypothetical protein [Nonomuraea typhae]
MCDLNTHETHDLLASLRELDSLAEQVATHASSVEKTAYMDHEGLAALLTTLRDRAESTRAWVTAKPAEHAAHHHS